MPLSQTSIQKSESATRKRRRHRVRCRRTDAVVARRTRPARPRAAQLESALTAAARRTHTALSKRDEIELRGELASLSYDLPLGSTSLVKALVDDLQSTTQAYSSPESVSSCAWSEL